MASYSQKLTGTDRLAKNKKQKTKTQGPQNHLAMGPHFGNIISGWQRKDERAGLFYCAPRIGCPF